MTTVIERWFRRAALGITQPKGVIPPKSAPKDPAPTVKRERGDDDDGDASPSSSKSRKVDKGKAKKWPADKAAPRGHKWTVKSMERLLVDESTELWVRRPYVLAT